MSKTAVSWKNHLVELMVVIFGITIAFSIDKYAEQRKESSEMAIALESIMDDLRRDISTFENGQIPQNQNSVDRLNYILDELTKKNYGNDTLKILIPRVFGSANSRVTNATFESLKSSGKLEDIPNIKVRREVVSFYQRNYSQSDYLSNVNVAFSKQLADYVSTVSPIFFTRDFTDRKLLTDPGFQNMLARWRNMISFKVNEYRRLAKESKELLELMESELN